MRDGAVVALVSDAGMPLVSDPGFVLVQACVAAGLAVEVLPGPSAASVVTAMIRPPRPPGVAAAQPTAPGNALTARFAGRSTAACTAIDPVIQAIPSAIIAKWAVRFCTIASPLIAVSVGSFIFLTSGRSRCKLLMTPVSKLSRRTRIATLGRQHRPVGDEGMSI